MANESDFPPIGPRLSLVPVPGGDEQQRRKPLMSQQTWWERVRAWICYQQVQIRWDIERALARLLRRRWGA